MIERIILIVLDSVGIGYLPDADKYNDLESNTLGNIAAQIPNLKLKNLSKLGLGNIDGIKGFKYDSTALGCYGKALEQSPGKDTTTGHWEIGGIILDKPFPTFPNGFPEVLISNINNKIGVNTIGNEVASGTEIINRLGDEHVKTGYPIIYTSADSVLQIAAHEEIIPTDRLYEICKICREILIDEFAVGRVIARPFIGSSRSYTRTHNRKDFSLKPIANTFLDIISSRNMNVMAVGKIEDIFAGRGITEAVHTKNNLEGIEKTMEYMQKSSKGLIFTNLVDFDMLYGHRNDVHGYANALVEFDNGLAQIINEMKESDMLIITADHGCDPTTESTDHSREYIPIIAYGHSLKSNINIGTRNTFADIGATVLDFLGMPIEISGASFKSLIYKGDK